MDVDIRKGMPCLHIDKEEFRQRFFAQFYDPAFAAIGEELERAFEIAWQAYEESRKAPSTLAAWERFDDPDFQLSEEWLAARQARWRCSAGTLDTTSHTQRATLSCTATSRSSLKQEMQP